MWKYINENLLSFKGCFSRKKAFKWFVIVIIGLIVRDDHLGVTSIIRVFGMNPYCYECLIHFFRADSWQLITIRLKWIELVLKSGLAYNVNGSPLLIADGVKQGKEGRKMPCVVKHHQESENSSKAQYIFGHMFGAIGILIGTPAKWFCTLLSMRIHVGNETISKWAGDELADESHVTRVIREAYGFAEIACRKVYLTLDRYFLTVPALEALADCAKKIGGELVSIVTKAKMNAKAYMKPVPKTTRGRPAKRGKAVKLRDCFSNEASSFIKAKVMMYGKVQEVEYLVKDLLWGQKLYRELRFVLVKYDGIESILVSTDLSLSAETIIEIYALRFKIETCFREFKQAIAGFAYHFWTSVMPRLNRFGKNSQIKETLEAIQNDDDKASIVSAFKAIEGFAMFAIIAFGLVQMVALRFANEINNSAFRWLRTKSCDSPSEATTIYHIKKTIFLQFQHSEPLDVIRFIRDCQKPPSDSIDAYDS